MLKPGKIESIEKPDEEVGQTLGRYKLTEQIGEGGWGVVYVAEQTEPVRRRVALKIIKLGMDTKQVVARFEGERQALAMMDHPNIARVLDAGATDSGRPFFVMELASGLRITDYCESHQLSVRQRVELFTSVCHAVQHAHQKGIVHRDLKPSNILVVEREGGPAPKVIDFGIAKATGQGLEGDSQLTSINQFLGTPAYMSPEQVEFGARDVDTRSDIYSLGVILYELLARQPPFDPKELAHAGLDEMRRMIREQDPPKPSDRLATNLNPRRLPSVSSPPREMVAAIRGDLDCIVMKCLEKDRTRRYPTANGLASDLKRHLDNEPILARPPSATYKFQKAFRRHRLAFVAGTIVLAALLVSTIVSTWQVFETRQARNAEKEQRLAAQRSLYAANINLAQQAWDQPNVLKLRQLLEETQTSPDRGFEWFYWQRQAHLALATLRGHLGTVTSVSFSPDGRRIVTGSIDKTAKVWDTVSGRELLTLKGHTAAVWSVAFSPDGQRIFTGGADQTARVWETANGRELMLLKGHTAPIYALDYSPDGKRMATRNAAQTVKIWDATTGRELLTLSGHTGRIYSLKFSPNGQRIITASGDRTAKVWDAATGRELLTLKGHDDRLSSVAISADGRRIVTGSDDLTAKVWDAATGRELLSLKGHRAPVWSVAISPDGRRIATVSQDETVRVWDGTTGRELFTVRGQSEPILAVAFSPDGRRIVAGGNDQTARVWDGLSDPEPRVLNGHSGPIRAVAFSPDGKRIVTGSTDRTARVWDAATGQELLVLKGHNDRICSVAFSPDSQRILTASHDLTARLWDAASGRDLLTLRGHNDRIWTAAFSSDGKRIVTASDDRTAKIWEAAGGRELLTLNGYSNVVLSAAFSPDDQRIATCNDRVVRIWEVKSGRQLVSLQGHSDYLWMAAFSPDGQRIVSAGQDRTAKVWDAAKGWELLTLKGHSSPVRSAAFSPDGQRIVTASGDGTAKVWDAATGRDLLTLTGHRDSLWAVAFSPDGKQIVTGSEDGTARIWEAAGEDQVTAWQAEEAAAAQRLAASRSEQTAEMERQRLARGRDEGAIKRWRVLAPIPLAVGQNGAQGLETEQIPGEAWLRPKAGETQSLDGHGLRWQDVDLKDYQVEFKAITGHATPQSVAYAVCYIQSEADLSGLRMLVGCSDVATVYLNGKRIHESPMSRPFNEDQDTVPDIALNAGPNLLVFKVATEISGWAGSIRFTDSKGNPVRGIKVTLDPAAVSP